MKKRVSIDLGSQHSKTECKHARFFRDEVMELTCIDARRVISDFQLASTESVRLIAS